MTASDEQTARRWLWRRRAYFATLYAAFALAAFYVGPNLILFGKLTWLTPADFAPFAERNVAPIVRALKAYSAQYGHLPDANADLDEVLVPAFLPPPTHSNRYGATLRPNGTLDYFIAPHNHTISYDFSPAHEGWSVHGPFTSGSIPLPLVPTPVTATKPSTQRG